MSINLKVKKEGKEEGREEKREDTDIFSARLVNFPMPYEATVLCNFPMTLIKDVM